MKTRHTSCACRFPLSLCRPTWHWVNSVLVGAVESLQISHTATILRHQGVIDCAAIRKSTIDRGTFLKRFLNPDTTFPTPHTDHSCWALVPPFIPTIMASYNRLGMSERKCSNCLKIRTDYCAQAVLKETGLTLPLPIPSTTRERLLQAALCNHMHILTSLSRDSLSISKCRPHPMIVWRCNRRTR